MGKMKKTDKEKSPANRKKDSSSAKTGKKIKTPINKNIKKNSKKSVKKINLNNNGDELKKNEKPDYPIMESTVIPGLDKLERISNEIEKLDKYTTNEESVREPDPEPEKIVRGFKPLTILDHFDAFRSKILTILVSLIILTITGFIFSDYILTIINKPFIDSGHKLNIFNITGGFIIRIKISFGAAFLILFPYIIYQIWNFIAPALSAKSRKFFNISFIAAIILFYTGIAFTYFIILPASINILLGFIGDEMFSTIGADDYVNFLIIFCIALGILFDFPVVVMILTKIGIINPQLLIKYRRHSIVIIWIIAALVTPTPDPFGQAIVAVPLMIFYEISILGSKMIVKRKKEEKKGEE